MIVSLFCFCFHFVLFLNGRNFYKNITSIFSHAISLSKVLRGSLLFEELGWAGWSLEFKCVMLFKSD
jgi:hypothetical protein